MARRERGAAGDGGAPNWSVTRDGGFVGGWQRWRGGGRSTTWRSGGHGGTVGDGEAARDGAGDGHDGQV